MSLALTLMKPFESIAGRNRRTSMPGLPAPESVAEVWAAVVAVKVRHAAATRA
jgi:hypothetical protein